MKKGRIPVLQIHNGDNMYKLHFFFPDCIYLFTMHKNGKKKMSASACIDLRAQFGRKKKYLI